MHRRFIRIGTIAGAPVVLDIGWFLLVAGLLWALPRYYLEAILPASSAVERVALALGVSLVFSGTILLHELAHLGMASALRLRAKRITLTLFGGAVSLAEDRSHAAQEFLISLAGPGATLALGLVFGLLHRYSVGRAPVVAAAARALQLACIGLGLFNLFPALPLDGGQALRAVLWALSRDRHTAGFWAARIGQWAGSAMTIVGLMGYLSRDANQWIWLAVVGLLVEGGARAAYRQVGVERAIEGHVAADVMVRGCVPLSPDLTLDQLDGALARRSVPCLVVGDERGVYGMLTGSRIRRVRRSRRGRTTLMQVLLPIAEQHRVSPEMPLREVLERMFDSGLQELPVMRDGAMLGIAVHHEIVRLIESRSIGGLS